MTAAEMRIILQCFLDNVLAKVIPTSVIIIVLLTYVLHVSQQR